MTFEPKTYARAIDMRSFIEARPELAAIPYEQKTIEVDGKRRVTARFTHDTTEQAIAVRKAGFTSVPQTKAEPMPKAETKSMSEKAMLADLMIKGWSGRASDKEAASHVAQSYQANVKWFNVSKRLVNTEALKAIRAVEAAARATHKKFTLPWSETGPRLLPAKAFHEYTKEMGAHMDAHEKAVDELIEAYDGLITEARSELGGRFDHADYPTPADLQAKFTFDSELSALDVVGDFRVQMSDAEMERLQAQITKRTEARLAGAMTDVYQRLHEVVAHMAQRLRDYDPNAEKAVLDDDGKAVLDDDGKPVMKTVTKNPFRDATLRNVSDIVDLMPKLNITGDPELDALAADVRATLLATDAKTLRTDADARKAVADQAEKIAGAMAGMM